MLIMGCFNIASMLIYMCPCYCCCLQAVDKYGADALFGRLPAGPTKPRDMTAPLQRISLPSENAATNEQQQQQQRMSRASGINILSSGGGAAAARGPAIGGLDGVLFTESGGLLHSPVSAIIRTSAVFPERFGIPGQGETSGTVTPAIAVGQGDHGKRPSCKKGHITADGNTSSESRSGRNFSSSLLVQHRVLGYQTHVNPMYQESSQSEHPAQTPMYGLTPRISEEESAYATPRQSDDGGDECVGHAGTSGGRYAGYAPGHSAAAPVLVATFPEQQQRGQISRQTSQHSKWKMPSKLLMDSNNKAASISSPGAQARGVSSSVTGTGCHHQQQLQHLREGSGVRAAAHVHDEQPSGVPACLYHLEVDASASITVRQRSWGTQMTKLWDLQDDHATGVVQKPTSWLSRVRLALREAWRIYQDDGAGGDVYQHQKMDPSMDAAALFWFKKPTLVLKVRMKPGFFN